MRAVTAMNRDLNAPRVSERGFFAVAALLFASSAAVTIAWCASMSAMGGMPMPGGWTMSMTWMRMSGQTWLDVAAMFLGMWSVMMVAMMLPSLAPMLLRYREALRGAGMTRVGMPSAVAGAGYLFTWTAFGLAVFPFGIALASIAMQSPEVARAVPLASGVVVLLAGALQFSEWKLRHLACCRSNAPHRAALSADVRSAWKHGLRLGLHCGCCCAGPMAVLLVLGVMDLFAMAIVTAAITAERLAPAGPSVARITGVLLVGAGLLLTVTAVLAF